MGAFKQREVPRGPKGLGFRVLKKPGEFQRDCNNEHANCRCPNKGFYIVPFPVCYSVLVGNYGTLPKKELHCRFWVYSTKPL